MPALYAGMGYRVVEMDGTIWRSAGRLALVSEPSGAVHRGAVSGIRAMLRRERRLAAIFCTGQPSGKTVAHFSLTASRSAAAVVQRQFAQNLKRAAAHGTVRPLDWREWHALALGCDRASLRRHGTIAAPCLEEEGRRRLAEKAARDPTLVLYGYVTRGGEIAAYLLCRISDGLCQGLFMHWDDALAELRPTHLLYHEARKALLARPDVALLRIGRQALPANPGLDRFKRHAGFETTPCHVGVLVHPLAAPLLESRATAWLLGLVRRRLAPRFPALAALEVLECAAPTRRALRSAGTLRS
ncbi:GNAT family N-acetyltransferase [Ancylobacter lacus]|uniref:GNAT family N-acetyltransferase n=1 Tax=Ancylobacter lacus TaxID=2579970 RepID=UPI001BCFD81C|nr:GNAT family N-acetyltransferase [Ancylobacter lacus]MBS7538179.1 GNAT family N-acetyltransferase [Ancylobacter lacus]